MKVILFLSVLVWTIGPVWGQESGHYDLIQANESIRGINYVITIASWEQQKLDITIKKPAGTSLEIRVRSADRQVLSSDRAFRLDQLYRRVLNVSQLEPGRYWLEIQVGRELVRRELRLESTSQTYRVVTMH